MCNLFQGLRIGLAFWLLVAALADDVGRLVGAAVAGGGHRPRAADDREGARRAEPCDHAVAVGETAHVDSVAVVVEPVESKRRTRTTPIIAGIGVVVAASLVAYGFAQRDDAKPADTTVPPTIGVI